MELTYQMLIEYAPVIAGGIGGVLGGIATGLVVHRIQNKSGLFSYFVTHLKIGTTTDDQIFGSVAVTWNQNPIQNLYLSTIELKNESVNDYEGIVLSVYTSDTKFLTERTHILDSPHILEWSDRYRQLLKIEQGGQPTENQREIHDSQREYVIPVLNRGQVVRISLLNAAKTEKMPNIWVSTLRKGVRLRFQVPQEQVMGVSKTRAALFGVLIGLIGIAPLVSFVSNDWGVALVAFAYGLVAQIPGAYAVLAIRRVRELLGN